MKEKFPNLRWVIVMRHARYHSVTQMPEPGSKEFLYTKLGPCIQSKIPIRGRGKEIIVTSHELHGVVTGNYLAESLQISRSFGMDRLKGDTYNEGKFMLAEITRVIPQDVEVMIVVGHFEGVPGIASAVLESFGDSVDCFEPDYLDGVVIDMDTGEHAGVKEFFEVGAN